MEIRPDRQHVERLARKRQMQRDGVSKGGEGQPSAGAARTESAAFDSETMARALDRLKRIDPTRLHKLEELRQRLEDGTYRADPAELVDPVLEALLDGERNLG